MVKANRTGLWVLAAVVGLCAWPAIASAQEIRLEARLRATSADPAASGHATFVRTPGRLTFSTEVQDVRSTNSVQVKVNGATVGSIQLVGGFGDLNLDTANGQTVPAMRRGDVVTVHNAADGTLILQGTLRRR